MLENRRLSCFKCMNVSAMYFREKYLDELHYYRPKNVGKIRSLTLVLLCMELFLFVFVFILFVPHTV